MRKFIQNIFLIPVYFYQYVISPLLGPGKCRYTPSCSAYFVRSVRKFGIFKGSYAGVARILRCRRSYLGGPDPVLDEFSFKAVKDAYTIYKKPKETGRRKSKPAKHSHCNHPQE